MKNKIIFFVVFAIILLSAPAVKAEAAAFRQTGAKSNSVTVSWDTTYNNYVQGYNIYVGNSSIPITVSNTTNSYTITGLQQGCAYSVLVLCKLDNKNYYFDSTSHNYIVVRTKPKQMKSKYYSISWDKNDKIKVEYTDKSAYTYDKLTWYKYIDGIELKVKDLNGKKKKTVIKAPRKTVYTNDSGNLLDSFSFKAPKAIRNKGMQYQLRTYIRLDNGKKIYSDWTKVNVFVPQAKISKVVKLGSNKVQVTWKAITNAESYTIWKTTDGGENYEMVQTVSANTTTYTVSDYKKDAMNGVVITAKVKVGGKNYNSKKSYYTFYK